MWKVADHLNFTGRKETFLKEMKMTWAAGSIMQEHEWLNEFLMMHVT